MRYSTRAFLLLGAITIAPLLVVWTLGWGQAACVIAGEPAPPGMIAIQGTFAVMASVMSTVVGPPLLLAAAYDALLGWLDSRRAKTP